MSRYCLIKGFDTHDEAQAYADLLPAHAVAKVVPYSIPRARFATRSYLFAVDVSRDYTGGRL